MTKNENATKSGFGAYGTDKEQSLTSKSSAFQSDFEDVIPNTHLFFANWNCSGYDFCKIPFLLVLQVREQQNVLGAR